MTFLPGQSLVALEINFKYAWTLKFVFLYFSIFSVTVCCCLYQETSDRKFSGQDQGAETTDPQTESKQRSISQGYSKVNWAHCVEILAKFRFKKKH